MLPSFLSTQNNTYHVFYRKISYVTECVVVDINEEEIQTKEIMKKIRKHTLLWESG